MTILKFFVLVFLAGQAAGYTLNVNTVVDRVVDLVNDVIRISKRDLLRFHGMSSNSKFTLISKKLNRYVGIPVNLNCTIGFIESLASLKRSGDSFATWDEGTVTAEGKLTLENLKAGYHNCMYQGLHLRLHEGFNMTSTSNVIKFAVTFESEANPCISKVDYVEMVDLGDAKFSGGINNVKLVGYYFMKDFLPLFKEDFINRINDAFLNIIPVINLCNIYKANNGPYNKTVLLFPN